MADSALLPPHLRASPVAVACVDLAGRIVDANASLVTASGYSLHEIRGRSFSEFIERDSGGGSSKFDALVAGAIDAYRVERRYRTRTGEAREVELAVSLVRDGEGRPHSCLAILQDVTPHKIAIREAARRAAELESIIQSIPAAVYIGDETSVKITNRAGLDQLGFTSVDQLTQDLPEIVKALHVRDLRTGEPVRLRGLPFVRAFGGTCAQRDLIIRHRLTGEDRIQRITAAPIVLDGRNVGAIAISVDITEQVRSDQDRREAARERERLLANSRRAHEEAEEASRVRDEFLAILSHELRTPLNAVLGWTTLLRSRPTGDKFDHAVSVIERNAKAQARLIDDLLEVSRIITGKIRLRIEPVNLAAIAAESVESVRPAADAKRIRLELQAPQVIPTVSADPQRIQQVFWNLLSNAVKFTLPDGQVTVSFSANADVVEARVTDSGVGIPADVLPAVFDRFVQADSSSTRAHSGLGLGLAIVRHLIELHGGTVHAESPGPGGGATFRLVLPRPR